MPKYFSEDYRTIDITKLNKAIDEQLQWIEKWNAASIPTENLDRMIAVANLYIALRATSRKR